MPREYPEYEDESPEETYRDPLKPFLIALVVLLLLFAAIIVLLYMRLQTANTRAETLSQELTAVQVQLDDLRAQRAAETPTPTPTPEPEPEKPAEETTVDPFITSKAREVIAGKWGNGQARKDALAAWFTKAVQDEVNRILGG